MKMPFASMRASRTTAKDLLPAEPEPIPQSMSDPMDLERMYSDDSSVFSGLAERDDDADIDDILGVEDTMGTGTGTDSGDVPHHGYQNDYYDDEQDENNPHRNNHSTHTHNTSNHAPKGILRGYSSKTTYSSSKMGGTSSEESDYTSDFPSDVPTESTLTDRSRRSLLREMPPMVDSDTAFGQSTISTSGNTKRTDGGSSGPSVHWEENAGRNENHSSSGASSTGRMIASAVNPELFPDSDTNTQMTWASANDMPRPKGTVKLVSSVLFLGDKNKNGGAAQKQQQDEDESRGPIETATSDDSGSRIVEMLNDFEKTMDANLKMLQEDGSPNRGNETNEALSELQDAVPRQTKSEDEATAVLTPHKAKKLQRILHKARQEVEVLRDNNEQFKSEIEQMEEEHKSEVKLIEDRTKQKLAELRSMYQEEIDKLALEKDAAVIEAGRQAARYAESGKKQVVSMKHQLERLTTTATATIKEKVEEAGRTALAQKDKEIAARLGALRNSYESELEKMRKECDNRVKSEVEKAVSSVSQRVRLNQDVLVSELRDQTEGLRKERKSMEKILKAVKENFGKHYPEDMKAFEKKSDNFVGSARRLLEEGPSNTEGVENELKSVIETFAFLLECQEKRVKSAQYMSEIEETKRERNEVYGQMRKELLLRHRAEIEHMKKEKSEAQEKLKEMETNFKNLGREKRFLEEKHRRAMENHRVQLEKLETEKKAVLDIEKSKREMAVAMAAGQREMKNNPPIHPHHKKIHVRKPSLEGLDINLSESADTSLIHSPSPRQKSPLVEVSPNNKYAFESASVRKARTFMNQHSPRGCSPRHSPRVSPRVSPRFSSHARGGVVKEKQIVAGESPIKTYDLVVPEKKIQLPKARGSAETGKVPENNEQKSRASSIDAGAARLTQPKSSLDPTVVESKARESVDPVPEIQNSKSDTSSSSGKSKDTILSNLRNQAKKAKNAATAELQLDPSGDAPDTEPSARRRSFAILRSFKSHKESNRRDTISETPAHDAKESDDKPDNHNIMSRSIRRARIIKNLFDTTPKQEESHRSRTSLASLESISSLQTNTGVNSGSPNAKDVPLEHVIDARQSKAFVRAKTTDDSKSAHDTSHGKKSQNTLGMFVHAKKQTPSVEHDEKQPEKSHETDVAGLENLPASYTHETLAAPTANGGRVSLKDSSSSHLNFKKTTVDGCSESDSGYVASASHINGKKTFTEIAEHSLDPVFTMNKSSSSDAENHVPKTVTVISPSSAQTHHKSGGTQPLQTATASGHTLLCKPLSLKHGKGYPPETISNLSQGTSATATSSEEDGLMYDSQAQMRKYPPLTDDEVSEEESGTDSRDKYQTIDSPEKQKRYKFVASAAVADSPSIPLVESTSVDDEMQDPRKSIVVQGRHVHNPTGLASFKPSARLHDKHRSKDYSETSSTAESNVSEATTAVTAHTRSVTFNSARRNKSLPIAQSSTHSSARFAALKARVRVRKEALA
ncbi:MAG: hypothetical protein SGILL_003498 [Bacillariaceae sp.]